MKIKVNAKNERIHYPDVWGNLKQDISDQFGVKVKKLSLAVHSDKWTKGISFEEGEEGKFSIDLILYVKSHVTGFVNAPILQIEGKEIELTQKILFSSDYEELYPVIESTLSYIQDMYTEDDTEDVKK